MQGYEQDNAMKCSHSAQNSKYQFTKQRLTNCKYLSDEVPLIMKVE